MSAEKEKPSREIQRKNAQKNKRHGTLRHPPLHSCVYVYILCVCVKEKKDVVFLWSVEALSDDLTTPHPPRIPSGTCFSL